MRATRKINKQILNLTKKRDKLIKERFENVK
jgi:hypothetical protein